MGAIEKEKWNTEMTTQFWNALATQVLEFHYSSCAAKLSLNVIFFNSCFSLKALFLPHPQEELRIQQSQLLAPQRGKNAFSSYYFPIPSLEQGLQIKAQSIRSHKGLREL